MARHLRSCLPRLAFLAVAILGSVPASAVAVIDAQDGPAEASKLVAPEAEKDRPGLSATESAAMLIGSLVFSAVLLGRKLD